MTRFGEWLRTPPGMPSDEQLSRALVGYQRYVTSARVDDDSAMRLHMGAMAVAIAAAHAPSRWTPRGWWYALRITLAPPDEAAR